MAAKTVPFLGQEGKAGPRTKSPSSLLARANLVLGISASAIAFTSIVALAVFVILPIENRSADDEAGLIVLAAKTWVELDAARRPAFEIEMLENHDVTVSAHTLDLPYVEEGNRYYDLLASKLNERLDEPVRLMESDPYTEDDYEMIWANIPLGGYVMQVGISPQRQNVQPLYVGFVIVLFGAIIVSVTSGFIVRRVAQPLSRAAQAVEAFRGAGGFQPLPEEGPEELVTLAASFNAMARNVSELLVNRTTLLAGISHDLRTPLTRMRFALEMLPDTVDKHLVDRFERNLTAMEDLIADALRFSRGAGEEPTNVDFRRYLETVAADIDEDLAVVWRDEPPPFVQLATGAFRRVVANLVKNARQHGGGAELVVDCDRDLVVHVIDDGPGIPADDRDKVFQPFYRLEGSRSRATGGSGLGLAIVAQLCQAHGWQVQLADSPTGGTDAQVVVVLPRTPPPPKRRDET
ncbi:MAG: ATP-binding protein [Gammaproteobacteria bacterium]|nr:ATP-binding protein [Gammaproteobacteria bacterium]